MMKATYKHLCTAALLACATTAAAQSLNSAYFTNDYKFRHTMNPAMANEQNYVSIPALGNISLDVRGNFGVKDVILNNPLYGQPGEKRLTTFMNPNIDSGTALDGFSSGNNRLIEDLNLTLLSAGFKAFGGYNTIELNVKQSMGLSLPYELFEFAKNTGNSTYDIGDINANAQAYVELAFGHSRQLTEQLRVGAKLKFLFGAGRADIALKDMRADLSSNEKWTISGTAEANVSVKGLQFKSEEKEYKDPERGTYKRVNDVDVDGGGLGGFGMAVDLGAVYKLNDDWTFSAALLDLGFISWSNNVTAVNSGEPFEFDGFNVVAVNREDGGHKLSDITDDLADQFTKFSNLEDQGDKGGRTTGIGATLNLGAQYTLPVYRQVKFGFLSSTRIRGKYSWTEGRLSANYEPLKWIDGGVNLAVNSFAASFGWVLNIHPKGYNFFIGMDHMLGSLSKEGIPLNSNASINMGMSVTW